MKVAIDLSPLNEASGHKVRGVGFYLQRLKDSLEKYETQNDYIYFQDKIVPQNADVIHYPYFDPFSPTFSLDLRKKNIITLHDVTPLVFPKAFPVGVRGKLHWFKQKKVLQAADAIITDSAFSKKDIMRLVNIPSSKIEVVYLAAGEEFAEVVPEKLRKEVCDTYNLPERFGLYVGDVTWNKNLPRLVKAIQKAEIPFVFVGKALTETANADHPWNGDRTHVQELLKKTKDTTILGFVPTADLRVLYASAQFFVMPSLYEGFGLPILEAMSAGCPVITTKEGSLSEVAGDAAYYVDAYDEEDIAKGMKAVFGNMPLQKELIEKGKEQATLFSWKKVAKETAHVYSVVFGHEQD